MGGRVAPGCASVVIVICDGGSSVVFCCSAIGFLVNARIEMDADNIGTGKVEQSRTAKHFKRG